MNENKKKDFLVKKFGEIINLIDKDNVRKTLEEIGDYDDILSMMDNVCDDLEELCEMVENYNNSSN